MTTIKGYKAYYKGLINQFGEKHEVGKTYTTDEVIYEKKGLYFSPYLEDTLRYYNGLKSEIDIAMVEGSGQIREFYDDYYDTTTIAATNLKILSVMTRKEIFDYATKLNDMRLSKFIAGYRLTKEEINVLLKRGESVKNYIKYYQYNEEDAFMKKQK